MGGCAKPRGQDPASGRPQRCPHAANPASQRLLGNHTSSSRDTGRPRPAQGRGGLISGGALGSRWLKEAEVRWPTSHRVTPRATASPHTPAKARGGDLDRPSRNRQNSAHVIRSYHYLRREPDAQSGTNPSTGAAGGCSGRRGPVWTLCSRSELPPGSRAWCGPPAPQCGPRRGQAPLYSTARKPRGFLHQKPTHGLF